MKKQITLWTLSLLCFFSMQAQTQYRWFDPQKQPQQVVRGQAFPEECKGNYHRFAESRKETIPDYVWGNSLQSAGLSVRFYSNSPDIKVRYTTIYKNYSMSHMPSTGVSGVDLYATDPHGEQLYCKGHFSFGDTIVYHYTNLVYRTPHQHGYEFELFFPLYNGVTWMEIGVPEDKEFEFITPNLEKPILIYGTSIAHGACASRPGMAWANIVKRDLDLPVINWGFSGAGRLDSSLFAMMSEVDAQLYILDNMPNMTNLISEIQPRMIKGVKMIREKSNAPILIVEHDGYTNEFTSDVDKNSYQASNVECRKAYEQLQKENIPNLFYLTHEEIGMDADAMVDCVHASDWGMRIYADAYIKKIRDILHMPVGNLSTTRPRKQRREPDNYNWNDRHAEILKLNREQETEIVMVGNSITHFWGGKPAFSKHYGEESWKKMFAGKAVTNMGCGWEKIENVLWRVYHGEMDGYKAKKIFMMLGTNNLNSVPDAEIVEGINYLLPQIRYRQPEATIYVVGIYPRRNEEEHLKKLNEQLRNALPHDDHIQYIDVSKALLQKDGKIDESLFIGDGLHPNEKGYQRIAKEMKPYL